MAWTQAQSAQAVAQRDEQLALEALRLARVNTSLGDGLARTDGRSLAAVRADYLAAVATRHEMLQQQKTAFVGLWQQSGLMNEASDAADTYATWRVRQQRPALHVPANTSEHVQQNGWQHLWRHQPRLLVSTLGAANDLDATKALTNPLLAQRLLLLTNIAAEHDCAIWLQVQAGQAYPHQLAAVAQALRAWDADTGAWEPTVANVIVELDVDWMLAAPNSAELQARADRALAQVLATTSEVKRPVWIAAPPSLLQPQFRSLRAQLAGVASGWHVRYDADAAAPIADMVHRALHEWPHDVALAMPSLTAPSTSTIRLSPS